MSASNDHPFWDLIDIARNDLPEFVKLLGQLSEQQLVDFYWQHGEAMDYLFEAGLRQHMGEWASDNTLEWLAEWIVDQGNDYWNDVLEDISIAPQRFPREKEVGLPANHSSEVRDERVSFAASRDRRLRRGAAYDLCGDPRRRGRRDARLLKRRRSGRQGARVIRRLDADVRASARSGRRSPQG